MHWMVVVIHRIIHEKETFSAVGPSTYSAHYAIQIHSFCIREVMTPL